MQLLLILTLVYAAVLVLALAASLIAIWVFLRRVGNALGEAYDALVRVEERTRPLEQLLEPFAQQLERTRREVQEAEARFSSGGGRLAEFAERVAGRALAGSTGREE
jgi:hypothetical protein